MSKKSRKKNFQGGTSGNSWFSSTDDEGEGFAGFSGTTQKSNISTMSLECHTCKLEYSIGELQMEQATYWLLQNMAVHGARWHCSSCLNDKQTEPLNDKNCTNYNVNINT